MSKTIKTIGVVDVQHNVIYLINLNDTPDSKAQFIEHNRQIKRNYLIKKNVKFYQSL